MRSATSATTDNLIRWTKIDGGGPGLGLCMSLHLKPGPISVRCLTPQIPDSLATVMTESFLSHFNISLQTKFFDKGSCSVDLFKIGNRNKLFPDNACKACSEADTYGWMKSISTRFNKSLQARPANEYKLIPIICFYFNLSLGWHRFIVPSLFLFQSIFRFVLSKSVHPKAHWWQKRQKPFAFNFEIYVRK